MPRLVLAVWLGPARQVAATTEQGEGNRAQLIPVLGQIRDLKRQDEGKMENGEARSIQVWHRDLIYWYQLNCQKVLSFCLLPCVWRVCSLNS